MGIIRFFYFIYVVFVFLIYSTIFFPYIFVISLFNTEKSRKFLFRIISVWIRLWLSTVFIKLHRIGDVKGNKYILVSNHGSYMDTIGLLGSATGYFRMLGNKEMSRIPLLSVPYKQIAILVDRSSKTSRSKSYKLMNRMVRRGTSIVIFPEGKFNLTSDKLLLDFYDGAFRLALDTKTNIIPVIMPDANNRWNNKSFFNMTPGKHRIIYLEPVDINKYGSDDLDKLKTDVYNIMQTELKKYKI